MQLDERCQSGDAKPGLRSLVMHRRQAVASDTHGEPLLWQAPRYDVRVILGTSREARHDSAAVAVSTRLR